MYKNEFDNILKQNKKFDSYMFYGQCDYLIETYAQNVALSFVSSSEIEKVYFDEYDFKQCKNRLLQSSLFSSKNILLIKLDKKLPKDEVTQLLEICKTNEDSVVIFACLGDNDFKTMEGYFGKNSNSVAVRFFSPFANEAIKLMEAEAQKLNIKYEISALGHLYLMHKNDLTLAINDLKKLAVLDETISSKVVDLHCFGLGSVNLEDFFIRLFKGENVLDDLNLLLDEGINEIFLLTQITSFAQVLFMINAYAKTTGQQPNAKEILGFAPPSQIWANRCALAISIKEDKFLKIFDHLNSLELELKSSKINDVNSYFQASLSLLI